MLGSFGRTLARTALCSLGIAVLGLFVAGCTNTFRQIALPLPTQTGDPAPLNRALFAATAGSAITDPPGSVTMVDVPGDTNVGVEQVGINPVMIGLTFGGGRAVTANTADNTASSFLTGVPFGTVNTTSLPIGSGATFVHSRQPSKFYIALSAIDALGVVDSSLALVKQVPLTGCTNPTPISQLPNGGNVYVGCEGGGGIAVVTSSDNVQLPFVTGYTGSTPVWLDASFDGKYTFVANQGSSTVSVICTSTDVTVCPVGNKEIASIPLSGAPSYVKYDTHSGHVLVAGAGFVSVLDASGTTPTFADVTGSPLTFSGNTWVTALKDGSRLYVSDAGAGTVTVFNMSNLQLLKTIDLKIPGALTTSPIMIDSDKNSTKVYTANVNSNDFSIINTATDTEVLQSNAQQRITSPALAGCLPAGSPACRQTPTFVVVLP